MNAAERAILERFKVLVAERVALHKLVVFGSRARGDADLDSDLDLLVLVEGPAGQTTRDWISDCAWEAGFDSGIVIVPVVYGRAEWERGPERYSLLVRPTPLASRDRL